MKGIDIKIQGPRERRTLEEWDKAWQEDIYSCVVEHAVMHAIELINRAGPERAPRFEQMVASMVNHKLIAAGADVKSVHVEVDCFNVVRVTIENMTGGVTISCYLQEFLEKAELLQKERMRKVWKDAENRYAWAALEQEKRKAREKRKLVAERIARLVVAYIKDAGTVIGETKEQAISDLMTEAVIRAETTIQAESSGITGEKAKKIADKVIESWSEGKEKE